MFTYYMYVRQYFLQGMRQAITVTNNLLRGLHVILYGIGKPFKGWCGFLCLSHSTEIIIFFYIKMVTDLRKCLAIFGKLHIDIAWIHFTIFLLAFALSEIRTVSAGILPFAYRIKLSDSTSLTYQIAFVVRVGQLGQ